MSPPERELVDYLAAVKETKNRLSKASHGCARLVRKRLLRHPL